MSAELRRLASMATPGPWTVGGDFVTGRSVTPGYEHAQTIVASTEPDDEGKADAAYIAAANPAVVTALLDRLETAEKALRLAGDWIAGPLATWVEQTPGSETIPEPPLAALEALAPPKAVTR